MNQRISAEEFHRRIEAGEYEEGPNVEFIDGLLVGVKPRLYAGAGVPVYWVIDLDGGRAVQHSEPIDGRYEHVEVVSELTAPHLGLTVSVADVLAASAR